MQKINVYSVLCRVKNLKLRVQETMVYKIGNKHPWLLSNTSDGYLSVVECNNPENVLVQWQSSSNLEILTDASTVVTKNIKDTLAFLSPNCAITKYNKNFNTVKLFWKSKDGTKILNENPSSTVFVPVSIKFDIENLRIAIDKVINPKGIKLGSFRVVFKVSNSQGLFISINDCQLETCESIKRFKALSNAKIGHFKVKSPQFVNEIKTTACSPLPLLSRNSSTNLSLAPNSPVDRQISEIMKDDESVKYISYKGWSKKVKSGEQLLPNEEKFAQKLVSFGKKDSWDSAREVQKLAAKLAINLDENKSKRHLQEAVKEGLLRNIVQSVKFSIPESEIQKKKPKKKNSILKVNVNDQIDKAVEQFDKLQNRIKRSKKLK